MYKLFIVEDDAGIAEAVAGIAEKWGLEACVCGNLSRVAEEFAACQPHIVLLDIMLPFFNGYYWCAELRKISKAPIIFLSSASDSMNIVMAMNKGLAILSPSPLKDFHTKCANITPSLRASEA